MPDRAGWFHANRCSFFERMQYNTLHWITLLQKFTNAVKQMLEALKNAGKEQNTRRSCFCAIAREPDDSRRPASHIDSDVIFRKFGFEKTAPLLRSIGAAIQMDGNGLFGKSSMSERYCANLLFCPNAHLCYQNLLRSTRQKICNRIAPPA